MIAEAVDTARTLAVALLVWIAVGSAVATAVVYAVAVGVWWAWRGLGGAVRAAGALRALRALPKSPDGSQGLLWPPLASGQRPAAPATGPSRPPIPHQTAPHHARGGFSRPHPRTGLRSPP